MQYFVLYIVVWCCALCLAKFVLWELAFLVPNRFFGLQPPEDMTKALQT